MSGAAIKIERGSWARGWMHRRACQEESLKLVVAGSIANIGWSIG
jgi:hypothetical protein